MDDGNDCIGLYDGDPPCTTCEKPAGLMPANHLPLKIWQVCSSARPIHEMSGSRMPLPPSEIIAVCGAHDATRQEFDRVMMIEAIVYPMIQEQDKQARKE